MTPEFARLVPATSVVVPIGKAPDSDSTLLAPETATAPVERIPLPAAMATTVLPPMVNSPIPSVPTLVLVNEAPVPLTPAKPRTPLPSDPAVRFPPAPIEIAPELATFFDKGARRRSVAPPLTVSVPVPELLRFVRVVVPAATMRLLNVFDPPSVSEPTPSLVTLKLPNTGMFTARS